MAKITKHQRELLRAADLRARALGLRNLPDHDWNDWEIDWLYDETQRSHDYIYSDKEWDILERLEWNALSFTAYAGFSVSELLAIGSSVRFDLDEDDQEFVESLYQRMPQQLKRRQIGRLASICRMFENVAYDDLIQDSSDYSDEMTVFKAA
jgi:hypothetical protein